MILAASAPVQDDATAFTATLRDSLAALRDRLTAATSCPIELHYGATEDGAEHWAALTVEGLPLGAIGQPGSLLVSVLTGPAIPSFAVVTSADLRSKVCTITAEAHLADGLQVAEVEALQRLAELSEGALA